jgi:hypothetical protein
MEMVRPSDEIEAAGAIVERERHIGVPLHLAVDHPHKSNLQKPPQPRINRRKRGKRNVEGKRRRSTLAVSTPSTTNGAPLSPVPDCCASAICLTVSGMVLDAPRICRSNHRTHEVRSGGTCMSKATIEVERTLDGGVGGGILGGEVPSLVVGGMGLGLGEVGRRQQRRVGEGAERSPSPSDLSVRLAWREKGAGNESLLPPFPPPTCADRRGPLAAAAAAFVLLLSSIKQARGSRSSSSRMHLI